MDNIEVIGNEPSVEELIEMETKKYEQQVQDLTFKLVNYENENQQLRQSLQDQENNFNTIVGRMICDIYGK